MYNHRKLSALAVLLLACFGQINAVQIACSSDSECSNGQGVCTSIGSSSYCSCLSGFGGEDCSVRPDSACDASFGSVSAVSQTLQAESYLHYQYPNLTLSVVANLEESKFAFPDLNDTLNGAPYSEEITVIFGDGSHTECDFPNNNVNWLDLAAAVGNCNDEYALSIAFTDAKSKCGFADNNGDRVFEQVIQINRKYELESLRGAPISRVDTVVKTLRVIFPLEVEVTTSNVQVVGSPSLLAAITLIDFDPSSTPEKWTVQTTTSIQSPFKLSNPQVISVTGSIDADSRFAAGSESLSVVSGCGSNAQDCFQQVSLDFVAGGASDACLGLQGDITIQFNVTCSDGAGAECPLLGAETVQVILTLDTSDACPITEQINFSTSTLSAYSDAAATSPRSAFITNQIAYFGADVQSADAQISARNVKDGSVCFQIVGNACQPVAFNVLTAANGKDPIFSVDFSDSANSAVFAALNAVDATSQLFDVHATIEVDFDGASKSLTKRSVEGTRKVQLSTTVKLSPGSSNSAEAALPNMIILFTFLVFALFF